MMTVLDPMKPLSHRRIRMRHAVCIVAACALGGCTPPTPRIDGVPGAPPNPETQWTVPREAQTPPPASRPPSSPQATTSMRADSSTVGGTMNMSMTDVVDLALRNNPTTRESWATARAAADEYGSARGSLFPSLDGSVNFSRAGSSTGALSSNGLNTGLGQTGTGLDSTGTRTTTGSSSTASRTQLTPGVTLSYLVFDLGGRSGSIEAAKQRAISTDLAHNLAVQNVVLQVESALFSFLATRAIRNAEFVSLQEAQADTAAAEARMRVGVGTLEEVLQTRTALAQAKLQLATDDGSLLAARGTLAVAMGFPANSRFDVPTIHTADSVTTIAASVDTLINRAIVQRPDLAGARADAEALAAQVRIARSAGYPALTLSSTASYARQLQGLGTTTGRNYSLVLGLQIPVFNGFSREYDVRAARELYEAGLARVTSTMQQITVQVFTSYAALQTATQRVAAAGELLTSAQQSADVALGRYREGVGTIVDLLLARTALASARADEIQARWEWRTALAQLAHDTGSLDTGGRPNIPLGPGPGIRR
jgi:outer membrane protein TolC